MRGADPQAVVRALGLRTVLPANWCAGLQEVAQQGVFVSPVVDGHVLAVGNDLSLSGDGALAAMVARLEQLSKAFGGAVWFTTYDEAEVHGWMLAERGELRRGYAFVAAAGHVFWQGDPTAAERELGCFVDDPRDGSDDDVKWWPDTAVTCALAAAWSLDPRRLGDRDIAPATGWVGRL